MSWVKIMVNHPMNFVVWLAIIGLILRSSYRVLYIHFAEFLAHSFANVPPSGSPGATTKVIIIWLFVSFTNVMALSFE